MRKIKIADWENMRNIVILTLIMLLVKPAIAVEDYLDNIKTFGYISGEGLACGATRYQSYEMIARAYLVSAARSDNEQAEGMYQYNLAKAQAYMNKKRNGLFDCAEVNQRFDNQKIFETKLSKNGKIKFPDGKVITPRQEYDVTLVYNRNEDERGKMEAFYNKIQQRRKKIAEKTGILKKIKQAEVSSNR